MQENPAHAIITGGSSGIGLSIACLLAKEGVSVSILARDQERLAAAKNQICSVAADEAGVEAISCDVRSMRACQAAVQRAISLHGLPNWAISCAGIVKPGTFSSLSIEDHLAQLNSNFIGSLNFASAVVPVMKNRGSARLVFVASGAALVGIYGYSGYAPSKFAVRGLAEVLRVELREYAISVTLALPPDTNTPQLEFETKLRPTPTKEIAGVAGVWDADKVALAIVTGARKSRFIVAPGVQLRFLSSVHSVVAPAFRAYQQWVIGRCRSYE
jgi:3-dehydrosphinganine reductase